MFFGARSPFKISIYFGAKSAFRKILGSVTKNGYLKKVQRGPLGSAGGLTENQSKNQLITKFNQYINFENKSTQENICQFF